jgi:hypothetical protein
MGVSITLIYIDRNKLTIGQILLIIGRCHARKTIRQDLGVHGVPAVPVVGMGGIDEVGRERGLQFFTCGGGRARRRGHAHRVGKAKYTIDKGISEIV